MSVPSDDDILGWFEAHPAPLKPKALGRKLGLPKNDWGDLKQTLFRLVRERKLEYAGRGGSFGPVGGNEHEQQQRQKPDHRAERAKSHRRFPDRNPNPADESAGPALPQAQPQRRPARGEPVNLVGIVVSDKKTGELKVQPCDKRRHDQFFGIIAFGGGGAKEGDIVVAEPTDKNNKGCKVTSVLGRKDDPGMFSLISLHEQGLRTEFSAAAMGEATNAAKMAIPAIDDKRRDERKTPFVTVDGADARDFDDAIWSEKTDKGWHIKVAIADVSWYVRPEDELNNEAYIRGNSTYFPDRVNPMLPKELSNGVCSLNPGVDRAVMVFEMWLDNDGEVTRKADPYRALINSAARLTYEQLQKAHDGQPDATTAKLMDNVVTPLYGAYEALAKARAARGTLDLELPEIKVKVKSGEVIDIGPYERLTSHKVIEEFMLAANVAAAQALEEKLSPCVYRVHAEPPKKEKLDDLLEYAAGFGLDVPEEIETRDDLRDLLAKAQGQTFYSLIAELMLRAQAKAAYSTENEGHYGLALGSYAHFTSPIRRYADLMVHRLLVTAFNMGAGGITADEKDKLQTISEHISETEVRSTFAERDSGKRYAADYLDDHIGETFSGQISSVNELGLFVKLDKVGVQGFIPRRQLPKDFYEYNEEDHALVGRDSGRLYRSGAPIEVRLRAVNPLVGLIDLSPANDRGADIPGFTNKFHPPGNDGSQQGFQPG
jgi:ribonuclease R